MNTEEGREIAIRRILVALDASTHSLAALEAAVKLAASLKAEIVGLFVEDVNLLRLAGLPFARELRYPLASRPLDSGRMEQELRLQAAQARRALVAAAERREVHWSFRVVRGQVTPEVLAAALEADLLTLGRASRSLTRRVRLGSTARAALYETPGSVLLVQQGLGDHHPVIVTYDGSALAGQALRVAADMARANGGNLLVLLIAGETAVAERLGEEVAERLRPLHVKAEYRRLPRADAASVAEAVRLERGGALVLGGERALWPAEVVQALLDELDCPVLLVR
ncbi:MAG: universal stress protein [Chloroflexota bacterium]